MSPYDNPRGHQTLVISVIFTVLGGLTVVVRMVTRGFIVKNVGAEDWTIVLAWCASLAHTVCIAKQVDGGMGLHSWQVAETESTFKAFFGSIIAYYLSLGLTKCSIILQYLRIFCTPTIRRVTWLSGTIITAFSLWTLISTIFICVPISYFWTRTGNARCLNQVSLWLANAAVHIVTDFLLIILPMPVIKNLNLPTRQKRALIIVFAVGGFTCVTSILRLQSLVQVAKSKDTPYDNAHCAYWSAIETNVSVLCACLPSLRAIVARIFPSIFGSSHEDSTPGYGTSSRIVSRSRTHQTGTFKLKSTVGSKPGQTKIHGVLSQVDSDDDIALRPVFTTHAAGGVGTSPPVDDGQIQVVTVVQQSIERHASLENFMVQGRQMSSHDDTKSLGEESHGESERKLV